LKQWLRFTDGTRKALPFSAVSLGALAFFVALFAAPHSSVAAAPKAHPSAYPTPYGAIVPLGVKIPVELVTEINSATFDIGDRFEFKTAQDEKLGDVVVPKGTLGHGRVSNLVRADKDHNGSVGFQTDSIDLPGGTPIWVNIDPSVAVHGHLADKRTHFYGIAIGTDYSGNMILDPGSPFMVVTIARRAQPAPLVTPSPSPAPSPSASTH
jgi:hypothetical protein